MDAQEHRNLQEAYLGVYEEVDKRRSPKELVDRLNASIEGHMAKDGPNKPAYDAKQRLLKKAQKRKFAKNAGNTINRFRREETDLYDIILTHLLDEGYADTEQAAEAIMVNMSEDWRESIMEMPYQIYGPDPTKSSDSPSIPLGRPYKSKKRATTRANKLDLDIGGYRHTVHQTPE